MVGEIGRQTTSIGINKGIKKQMEELIANPDVSFNSCKGFIDFYVLQGIKKEKEKIKKE